MLTTLLFFAFATPRIDKDIVYSKVAGEELKMDMYTPATAKASDKLPVVVVIHGGAWIAGKRTDMNDLAMAIADRGMVAATVSYRLAPKHKFPAMIDDVQTAVRFLRSNATKFGIDPNRIGAAGASAGGHLSIFLGSTETRDTKAGEYPNVSSKVQAVLNLFGPTDMTIPFPASADPIFVLVLGKKKEDAKKEITDASPLNYVDKNTAPIFTVQGLADPLVDPKHARVLDEKLQKVGVAHKTVFIDGMKHEVDRNNPAVMKAVEEGLDFLKSKLSKS